MHCTAERTTLKSSCQPRWWRSIRAAILSVFLVHCLCLQNFFIRFCSSCVYLKNIYVCNSFRKNSKNFYLTLQFAIKQAVYTQMSRYNATQTLRCTQNTTQNFLWVSLSLAPTKWKSSDLFAHCKLRSHCIQSLAKTLCTNRVGIVLCVHK